ASRTGEVVKIVGKSLVLTTGARERTRHMVMIPGFRGAGIFTAGLAQRLVNIEGVLPGRKVVILGSGDVGLIMARRLTLEGAEVVALVEILPYINGSMRNYYTCVKDFNIPTYLSHTIVFIHGKYRVTGVTIAQVDEKWNIIPGTEKFLECDTVLLSVGLIPENEIAKQIGVEIDPLTGGPVVDEHRQTSVEGVFAGGNNVQIHDLADEAAREGEVAARSAALFVRGELKRAEKYFQVTRGQGVRYVVPQKVSQFASDVHFYFRVVCPMEKVTARILCGDEVLVKKFLPKARPGEMIILNSNKSISNNVKVEVV
ncbi:MAG: FAD-dependent oxidoreductase, partial [Candidatus Korarchaeota archaeon]